MERIADTEQKVNGEMSEQLLSELDAEEVKVAIQQMYPTKSPRLNGMSPLFYQKYWDIVGGDITSTVIDFYPISRYNVLYKIVTKVFANKLELMLLKII